MKYNYLFSLAYFILCCSCQSSENKAPAPLNLAPLIQPIDKNSFYTESGYSTWDGNLFKESDSYYLVYSRWKSKGGNWLTTSEVCLAKSSHLAGPYKYEKVLLKGRGPGYWDELNAHNPKLKKFKGKYYLYYISSQSGPTRMHVRDSQRTGVAVADSLMGPYKRQGKPVVEPSHPVNNITVNPGVSIGPDGRCVMILKGDKKAKKPNERMSQRVQGIALADSPLGPFVIQPKLAISGIDTEDASLWYDKKRACYFAIYHAHHHIGIIRSKDGINWAPPINSKVMKKKIMGKDGKIIRLNCIERPFVFFENGEPAALCISVRRGNNYNTGSCLIIPLKKSSQQSR